ncbi:UDP-forming cellulose synthase catalytic subunit [Komagataeibacter diospyri]|uniref:Cellulose synthase n=1 Tax=Komagataeibacter diospyri TaxID=1932662 RepID=A0A4P5NV54_9PROT|nr:UDP-forming cellulose synthase catalytic subunit [Komagataeibacter diospyri]GCE83465.1 cellulose synthase catalytic subunit [Komagataeibacter diospyri]GCE90215.1 cellulose synthase catalytic subunit [Komagataeibacter diospyri]
MYRTGFMTGKVAGLLARTGLDRVPVWVPVVLGVAIMAFVGSVTVDPAMQGLISIGTVTVLLFLNRRPGRGITVFLMMLSLLVSLRYIVWRLTTTLQFDNWLQTGLALLLLMAETYALVTLCLSYFQMAWPLRRREHPLPDDTAQWPSVDVFVPSYNEELSLVRSTVLGALDLDWPEDKLHVYILDDGRRKAFRDFAVASGAGYIIRSENNHAKAGNLNHALQVTHSQFAVIFDCDHVPTRGFLKRTIGWMMADPNLALLQTPHHFYAPDPFQRNLASGMHVPPEGNMFYGLVQDGNDFWDATFFCGSCAIIRREAVMKIGGFATETVTEDAHTALKMQRRGWGTAYLREPLAAGLSTERLILHIGQRVRWARGMIQIMRLDNPMLGAGLRWEQRLCYLSAMSHFLFAIPRVTFLVSPLAYLFLGQNIIAASPLAISVYALPHIFHSVLTLSRIEGRWRYSFWSEIYETSLALFLIRITIVTLLQPHKGKFNVTDKGGLLARGYFDFSAVYPNIILAVVLFAAFVRGIFGIFWEFHDRLALQSFVLNTLWVVISMIIVLASIAVGRETRQTRHAPRVTVKLPVAVTDAHGRRFNGHTYDISLGGLAVKGNWATAEMEGTEVTVHYDNARDGIHVGVPAQVMGVGQDMLRLQWIRRDLHDEQQIVSMVFGRNDAWANWADFPADRPLRSLAMVFRSIGGLFSRRGPEASRPMSDGGEEDLPATEEKLEKQSLVLKPVPRSVRNGATASAALFVAFTALVPVAMAQEAVPVAMTPVVDQTGVTTDAPFGDSNTGNVPDETPAIDPLAADRISDTEVTRTITFRNLGATTGPLTLRGYSPLQGLDVVVPANRVVTHAQLTLSGALSPSLLPEASAVTVTMNEQYVGTIKVDPQHPQFGPLTFDIDPLYFTGDNKLNFRFAGEYRRDCNDLFNEILWARISDLSHITLTTVRIAPERKLSRLPAPFFDPNLRSTLRVPVVMPATGDKGALKAAGLIASWFGKVADFRKLSFPVSTTIPSSGNAVEVGENLVVDANGARPAGPMVAEIANPNDRWGTVLVVTGRNAHEVEVAARAVVFSPDTLGGVASKVVSDVNLETRRPYDAPAFVPTDRPVRFGELVGAADLQGGGFTPAGMTLPFHLPPDLYTWRGRPFLMNMWIRAPGGPVVDLETSRVDVSVNNNYLQSYTLSPPGLWRKWSERLVNQHTGATGHVTALPPWLLFGQNQLQFNFDARPIDRGACRRTPGDIRMSVDSDSTLDFRRGHHFAQLPNLSYFAEAAFPFSRMADLSETTVVLPDHPDAGTAGAFLDLMGFFGASTWYPAAGVEIMKADEVEQAPPKGDIVVLGTATQLGRATAVLARSPYVIHDQHITVGQHMGLQGIWYLFQDRDHAGLKNGVTANLNAPIAEAGVMLAAQSPYDSQRSVVAFMGDTPERIHDMVLSLRNKTDLPSLQGDLVLKNGDQFTSYRTAPLYTVGSLPMWMRLDWYLGRHPAALYLTGLAGTGLAALGIWAWLRGWSRKRVAHDDLTGDL